MSKDDTNPKDTFPTYYEAVDKMTGKKRKGEIEEKSKKGISVGLQKRLITRAGGKCENCGRGLYNQRIEIYHKNNDLADNRESNLIAVCSSCHTRLTRPPTKEVVET